jgi:acetyl-CoA carboxylase biotin carboxyl carrier protein
VTVVAPVVGAFYRSPKPGAPPFAEVGDEVTEDSTVGLVEVMKMFNSVTAGVRGRVVEILVENGDFVEYGQALMTIRSEVVG